jgi:transglutaminase-like putative cysteine protease
VPGVTAALPAVLLLGAGLAAVWLRPDEDQPANVRARVYPVTEPGTEIAQTTMLPTPAVTLLPLKKVQECKQTPLVPQRQTVATPAATAEVAQVLEAAFLAPGERVTKVYPDGLMVEARDGISLRKLKFRTLPQSVQKQYGYDPRKALEYEADEAKAAAQYRANEWRKAEQARLRQIAEDLAAPHQETERIAILSQIVGEYRRNHTYLKEEWFVCTDMAIEVWNMVRTKGIPAKIQVGNVGADITSLREANHAWVLAEASPGKWVALEATAGRLVYADENPRYYRGWSFDNPRKLKELRF